MTSEYVITKCDFDTSGTSARSTQPPFEIERCGLDMPSAKRLRLLDHRGIAVRECFEILFRRDWFAF